MNLAEYNAWANRNLPIEEAMLGALHELFVIPLTIETGFASHIIVDGDSTQGNVSIYTERGIVVDADYTNLVYDRTTSMWWVDLSNIELGNDPVHFETLDDPYGERE